MRNLLSLLLLSINLFFYKQDHGYGPDLAGICRACPENCTTCVGDSCFKCVINFIKNIEMKISLK